MEVQNKEKYSKIFDSEEGRQIFPMARYMMQLEEMKDQAVTFVDGVKNTKYPFIYTEFARPDLAIHSSEMLLNAITAEASEAENRFREALLKVLRDTVSIQRREFGYAFNTTPKSVCKITRNLKDRYYGNPAEDTDEEILEKIIFTIDLDRWCSDFYEDDLEIEEDEDDEGWLERLCR